MSANEFYYIDNISNNHNCRIKVKCLEEQAISLAKLINKSQKVTIDVFIKKQYGWSTFIKRFVGK